MTYRDNVQAVADKRGIQNPLLEQDLAVGGMKFWTPDGPVTIMATDMNRGSRLFFMEQADAEPRITESIPGTLTVDDRFRQAAALYFAELWDHEPGKGTHPVLDAIRTATKVDLFWKD